MVQLCDVLLNVVMFCLSLDWQSRTRKNAQELGVRAFIRVSCMHAIDGYGMGYCLLSRYRSYRTFQVCLLQEVAPTLVHY